MACIPVSLVVEIQGKDSAYMYQITVNEAFHPPLIPLSASSEKQPEPRVVLCQNRLACGTRGLEALAAEASLGHQSLEMSFLNLDCTSWPPCARTLTKPSQLDLVFLAYFTSGISTSTYGI
jgi:hypothetical protein